MRISFALLAVAFFAARAKAQHTFLSAMEYSIAAPIGETRRFGPESWSGGNWEGRWMYGGRMSFGTLFGFNEFYHRDAGTTTFPAGAVTGDQYRHLLTIPILVTAAWYIGKDDDPRWYVGAGAGTTYTLQEFQLGLDVRGKSNWGLALVPEVGLAFPTWDGSGAIVALRYHLATESSAFLGSPSRTLPYVSLSIGMGYR